MQSDIRTQFIRAGGAQIGCPDGGWVNGEYAARWNSVEGYYERTQAIGATFILLVLDLWGQMQYVTFLSGRAMTVIGLLTPIL
jgi:hypothetical protein